MAIRILLKEHNIQFRKRRDMIVEKLNNIQGLSCTLPPSGAFYVYPSCVGNNWKANT